MRYDIAALKRKMLVKYPFFGSVVASVDYKENKNIGTAGTDGKTIYYNPDFLELLDIDEQTFVFSHEVCHIAFNHILRSEGKDSELWNIATDGVINQFLKKDGLKIVEGGVDIADAINYDAEQLYNKWLEEKQQKQQNSQNGQENSQNGQNQNQNTGQNSQNNSNNEQSNDGQNSEQLQDSSSEKNNSSEEEMNSKNQSGSSDSGSFSSKENDSQSEDSKTETREKEQSSSKSDVGHDTHSMWEDAIKKHKEEQSKSGKKNSLLDKILNKQEELEKMGEKDAFKKNREEKIKELEELKKAIAKQASTAGASTNREVRTIEDIGTSKPLIDWRYILREAIKYEVDWSYKNAIIEDGVVSANLEEQSMPETEIVLDTSGSINEILLKNFLKECKNILQHSRLRVGCFDTEFYGFQEIRTEKDIENMKFEGGGGTNFDVAVGAFSRRVENKIIFTDGQASMPEMLINAIWIVFGQTKINPKVGKVINITPEQLDRLYSYEIVSDRKGRIR